MRGNSKKFGKKVGILRSVTSVHSNALKKRNLRRAWILRSIRGFIPSDDIVERVVPNERNRVVRYDRERCLVNVPKKFRASFFYIRRNSPFFSPFLSSPSSPPIFSPEFGGKKYSNPDPNPFQNWKIDVSNRCFRGQKAEKRTEREKQIEGKRFHRRIGRVRNVFVYNIPGRIGVLFTLRGIHSSPVKRVKTQKSESLFVTSFDVAINSFEITACAGRTGPNIRQQPVLLSKIQISGESPPPPQIYVLYSVPRRVSLRYMFG